MTPQEIFDTVARHLFAQGKRAGVQRPKEDDFDDAFNCRYRGPGGTKCAVGVLIPDEAYTPAMEGARVTALLDHHSRGLPHWMLKNADLLDRLQMVHDQGGHWVSDKRMRWELSMVAHAFGLDDGILPGLSFNRPEGQNA